MAAVTQRALAASMLLPWEHAVIDQAKKRLLFVDDEALLRLAWTEILSKQGFDVTTAASVSEALALITAEKYDALIADLNIGEPSDGFTIVSAMRRVQPGAVCLIFTGYPGFQNALRAIHDQVDDFLIKGSDTRQTIESIRRNVDGRRDRKVIFTQRLAEIIAMNRDAIIESWFQAAERDPDMKHVSMSRQERIDHLPEVLDELVQLEKFAGETGAVAFAAAARHGSIRRRQGYTVSMLLEETRLLHAVIAEYTQKALLYVDVSYIIPDLIDVGDRLHRIQRASMETFLHSDRTFDAA